MGAKLACSVPGCEINCVDRDADIDTMSEEQRRKATERLSRQQSSILSPDSERIVSKTRRKSQPYTEPEVPEQFFGTWTLIDKDHTDGFDEYFKANGADWSQRRLLKLAIGDRYTVRLVRAENGMNCDRLKPEFGTEIYRFGEFVKQKNPKGKTLTTRLSLVDTNGMQALVASVYMSDTPSTTTWSLSSPTQMTVTTEGCGAKMTRRMKRDTTQ